jgi:hypothetical protein
MNAFVVLRVIIEQIDRLFDDFRSFRAIRRKCVFDPSVYVLHDSTIVCITGFSLRFGVLVVGVWNFRSIGTALSMCHVSECADASFAGIWSLADGAEFEGTSFTFAKSQKRTCEDDR